MPDQNEMTQEARLLESPDLRDEASGSSFLDFLKKNAKTVTVDDEDFYVVEGDLVLDEDQLALYAINEDRRRTELALQIAPGNLLAGMANIGADPMSDALLGIVTREGKFVRWKEGTILSYCVLRDTFSSQERYELVRDNMQLATNDWERTCGVRFEHRAQLDNSPGTQNPGVLFTVREFDAGGQFIASAFFPTDPRNRRRVLIDPSYYDPDMGFNSTGVLRHELGHVLGYRHEHTRVEAPPQCPDEPVFAAGGVATPLTAYDPKSVMHYFCGGVGSPELALTELDRVGSQKVYGPPIDQFFYVEE
jgi:hypothetical protein